MGKYGTAAIQAVKLYKQGLAESPRDAWDSATAKIFGRGTSSQRKGCPRDTFLGLCEQGLVEGIEPGNYTRSQKNKKYATDAITILKQRPSLSDSPTALWSIVLEGEPKKHNSQMDVVTSLWNSGLICAK